MKLSFSLVIVVALSALTAFADSPTESAPPFSGKDRVLWDIWYTVTLKTPEAKTPIHYAYYNDRLELKKGQLYYKNQVWKKEEGFINEEQLGALSENSELLTPVVYNFHSTYRAGETNIDGSVAGHVMTVVLRKGDQTSPQVKKALPPKVFFSVFFPVWVGYRLPALKQGASATSFQTILEDNADGGFEAINGTLRLEKPDDLANKNGTRKLAVNYGNIKTFWWVDPSGVAERIEAPDQGRIVERTTKQIAEKFLEGT